MKINTANLVVKDSFLAPPSESGIVESFKNDGHNTSEYLAELIDNSKDAGATLVKVDFSSSQIKPNSKKTAVLSLIVADNGQGMSYPVVKESLKIGVRGNNLKKIGRYGIGLKSSVFSLGNSLQIITKTKAGEISVYLWDRNNTNRKDFEIQVIEVSSEHKNLFKKYNKDGTGTIILIQDIHPGVSSKLLSETVLIPNLERIFYKSLDKGFEIKINSKKLNPNPVVKSINKVLTKQKLESIEGASFEFLERSDEAKMNERGIYVELGDRLINVKPIQDNDFLFNHPSYNYLILIIRISKWSDSFLEAGFKINNQKNGVEISGILKEEIIEKIKPFVKEQRALQLESSQDEEFVEKTPSNFKSPELKIVNGVVSNSKLDNSWKQIGETLELVEGTLFTVDEQRTYLEDMPNNQYIKEARILNKMDNSGMVPDTLKKAKVVPFPLSNTELTLIKMSDAFLKIPKLSKKNMTKMNLKDLGVSSLLSLKLEDITSEKKALNLCHHHEILHRALNENKLTRTVEGMERLKKVSICIGDNKLTPDGVQIEVDAGYESSSKKLHLIEAKMVENELDDINIKQLILPHAHYQKKFNLKLEVVSWVFLWYKNENIARIIPVDIDVLTGTYKLDCKNEKVYLLY